MTLITGANKAFRECKFDQALATYKEIVRCHQDGSRKTHDIIYSYALSQIKLIDEKYGYKYSAEANIIITAVDGTYFQSLLLLLESITEKSISVVNEILVFDFGLESWQRKLIENVGKVTVFNYDSKLCTGKSARFDIRDSKTYFFKTYAFYFWMQNSTYGKSKDVNLMWIDCGIVLQQSLKNIFSIIDSEGCFFVDHADVTFFYREPQNLLVNILSPKIEDDRELYRPLTSEKLLTPYIKANFFGLRTGGAYGYLIDDYWSLCTRTDVLFETRDIKDKQANEYWLMNTDLMNTINARGLQNSGKYLYGRHEQTIWSYLVARDEIKIFNSIEFNFTAAPGSGYCNEDYWDKKIRPLVTEKYAALKDDMKSFLLVNLSPADKLDPTMLDCKDGLIDAYLKVGKDRYITKPKFCNVGFPVPPTAKCSVALLHRGSRSKIDQYKYSGALLNHFGNIRDDIFILLGNGPSLANVDLYSIKKYHTMGLNAAYRAYRKLHFWPKYFGCFDGLVCGNHSEEFKNLIRNSPIERFFFINIDDDKQKIFPEEEIQRHPKFQPIDFRYRTSEEKNRFDILATTFAPFTDMRTSGSNSIQTALLLGYRKIILLGVDQNYTEVVDGAATNQQYHKMVMTETPKQNPNYWFADYQQKGDKFNRPNLHASQIPAWNNLSLTLDHLGIKAEIYNCSPITALDCFKKASLEFSLRRLSGINVNDMCAFKSPLKLSLESSPISLSSSLG